MISRCEPRQARGLYVIVRGEVRGPEEIIILSTGTGLVSFTLPSHRITQCVSVQYGIYRHQFRRRKQNPYTTVQTSIVLSVLSFSVKVKC